MATMERLLAAVGMRLVARPVARPRQPRQPRPHMSRTSLRQRIAERRDEILRVAARHHATNVRLFGSVARGDETERSDIDLLVDMEPGGSLLDQVRLRRDLSDVLGVEVDVITTGGLLERDRRSILAEAVAL